MKDGYRSSNPFDLQTQLGINFWQRESISYHELFNIGEADSIITYSQISLFRPNYIWLLVLVGHKDVFLGSIKVNQGEIARIA